MHKISVFCNNASLPCQNPLGQCIPTNGQCAYAGIGQYKPCSPTEAQLDPSCPFNATTAPSNYVCATSDAAADCQAACYSAAVCGDGVVEPGEQCDWADPAVGGPCCNASNCQFYGNSTACNNSNPDLAANQSIATGLPLNCFPAICLAVASQLTQCVVIYDPALPGCTLSRSTANNRGALIGSLIAAGVLACCIAWIAFFLWRRSQKKAEEEWMQDFMDAGNAHIENNAAFVQASTHPQTNAAFDPLMD
jgi:hypothetical protein